MSTTKTPVRVGITPPRQRDVLRPAAPSRRRPRILVVVGLLLLVALLVVAGWFVHQVNQARTHLSAAGRHVDALERTLGDGDSERAAVELLDAQNEAAAAHDVTDGFWWPVVGTLPVVGDDVRAVRTVSVVLDDVAQRGLPVVVDAGRGLGPEVFAFQDGRMDLSPLVRLRPAVARVHDVLTRNDERLATIDADELLGAVRGPVVRLTGTIDDATTASGAAEQAMRVLPAMLGSGGPRSYLVVVQSNAQVRATGGYPGAYLAVTAEDGKVDVTGQGSSSADFVDPGAVSQSSAESRLYQGRLGRSFANANLTPDFPRAAELQALAYQRARGSKLDGVVSVDPVALSYLLRGLGPVKMSDGSELTAGNITDQLLNQLYLRYPDTGDQDKYLAQAASNVFVAFIEGVGEPRQVLAALSRGAREGRVRVWSSHLEDELVFADSPVAGSMPPTTSRHLQVGVYLNDTSDARLQYFLDRATTVDVEQCSEDGPLLTATTTFTSTVPADAAQRPSPIYGSGRLAAPGTMRMDAYLFAPGGGSVDQVEVDGRPVTPRVAEFAGRPVAVVPVTVAPGDEVTLTAEMTGAPGQSGRPEVTTTPGVREVPVRLTGESCG